MAETKLSKPLAPKKRKPTVATEKPPHKPTKPSTPTTMAELLASTKADITPLKRGDIVEGTVVAATKHDLLVDIGKKAEGLVSGREYQFVRDLIRDLKVGQTVRAIVLHPENEDGVVMLSMRKMVSEKRWQELLQKEESGEVIEGRIVSFNRGGAVVDLDGVRGFLPLSHIALRPDGRPRIGADISVKILELDPSQNRIVVSEKAVTDAVRLEKARTAIEQFHEGQIIEGVISAVVRFGIFVRSGDVEGLVHVSELSWEPVMDLQKQFKVGQRVRAKVIGKDPAGGKVSLSIKQLTPDPWFSAVRGFKEKQVVEGTISRQTSFGVFVQLSPGVEGLIHAARLPSNTAFQKGQRVTCSIEAVNQRQRIISLRLVKRPETHTENKTQSETIV